MGHCSEQLRIVEPCSVRTHTEFDVPQRNEDAIAEGVDAQVSFTINGQNSTVVHHFPVNQLHGRLMRIACIDEFNVVRCYYGAKGHQWEHREGDEQNKKAVHTQGQAFNQYEGADAQCKPLWRESRLVG